MHRRTFLGVSLVILASLPGCGKPNPYSRLTRPQIEADMAERLGLHDVSLVDEGGGRFVGKGTDSEGRTIELEVTQEDRRRTWKNKYVGPNFSREGNGSLTW